MQFSTGVLTRCAGQNHYQLPVTIGGRTVTLHVTRDEMASDPPESLEEAREMIITRLRSAIKEAGASTFAQVKTAIENKTNFRV